MLKRTYERLIDESAEYVKDADSWRYFTSGIMHTAMEDGDMLETDIQDLIDFRRMKFKEVFGA